MLPLYYIPTYNINNNITLLNVRNVLSLLSDRDVCAQV